MTTRKLTLIVASLLLVLPACGSAQMMRRDVRGGRIELSGAYMESVRDARAMMRDHCHGAYGVRADGSATTLRDAPNRDQASF
ncbi:MAG: hypothetical protein IT379_02785, partial [Deltaproteobacteria bacterium]|nr:hypothetical protein [Deltaproteobacteria bacterium]